LTGERDRIVDQLRLAFEGEIVLHMTAWKTSSAGVF
jgi:hypothetical protein